MNVTYLLLGSNLGNREKFLCQAMKLIEKNIGKIIARSAVYNTSSWPKHDQDDFLNQAISVGTPLSAEEVLKNILSAEKALGRERKEKWEARTIDIDILFFNTDIIQTPNLTVPHPHLPERRFALVPLAEIAGNLVHPVLKKTIKELLLDCNDNLEVQRI